MTATIVHNENHRRQTNGFFSVLLRVNCIMKMTDDNDKADTEEPNYSPYMNDIVVQENQQNR